MTKSTRLVRVINSAHAAVELYGIMVSEAISPAKIKSSRAAKIKRSRLVTWLTCLSLLVSLSGGIMVSESARAQSAQGASQPDNSTRGRVSYPTLSRYATDLTKQARQGQLEPVLGRDAEIGRTIEILSRDAHRNPVLIGEAGPGVAEVAEGLAQRIVSGDVPESLRDKSLFSLSLDALAARAKNSSEFTGRLQAVLADVRDAKGSVILFVDQLHQYIGAYATKAATDTLRAALSEGQLRIVGASSAEAYAQYIASDGAVSGLFQQVRVETNGNDAEVAKQEKSNEKAEKDSDETSGDKISPDLREMLQNMRSNRERVSVILQAADLKNGKLDALLKSNGVRVDARFSLIGAVKIDVPLSLIEKLAASGNTRYLSLDRKVGTLGHVTATTGADLVRRQTTAVSTTTTSALGITTTTTSTTTTTLDGTGIGIAVLDSGMDTGHVDFRDKDGSARIRASVDFTGENRVDDPFGHGSHVASIAAGGGRVSKAAYLGIAPNANLINLRVLNSKGTGSVSATLAALDWVMNNRSTYNIRVVNMSLGTPAIDSYKNDPLCRAVRRLVNAGIVVAAAAGNNGKNSAGQKVYGLIHSPGNEPSAITVGAANTFGTDARNDDGVATYSSRGPTRSYWKDAAGVKHYDNLIKPDLVAPGNKLVYAESDHNLLVTQNPGLDAGVSPVDNRRQMYLSGTSMATPVVAGAAALLLQANPNLTPNMIKAILEYTAQSLSGFNTFEQGAGEINIEGAVRLARLVRTDLGTSKPIGASLLTTLVPPTPQTTIAGYSFTWSQGLLLGHHWAKGTGLIMKYQAVYALGTNVSDGTIVTDGTVISDSDGTIVADEVSLLDGTIVSDGAIVSDGTIVGDTILISAGITMSDGSLFLDTGTIVSDDTSLLDGTIVSDGTITSDEVSLLDGTIVSDGTMVSDAYVLAQAAMLGGDLTDGAPVEIDSGVDFIDY